MSVKSDRVEARLSPEQRRRIARAAAYAGETMSAFMVSAAVERADELIAAHTATGQGTRTFVLLADDNRVARRDLHGQHLGSKLLVVALDTIIEAAPRAGGKLVVVDAIDEYAARFYAHHEFEPIPDNPHRLNRKLSTIARARGQPWP